MWKWECPLWQISSLSEISIFCHAMVITLQYNSLHGYYKQPSCDHLLKCAPQAQSVRALARTGMLCHKIIIAPRMRKVHKHQNVARKLRCDKILNILELAPWSGAHFFSYRASPCTGTNTATNTFCTGTQKCVPGRKPKCVHMSDRLYTAGDYPVYIPVAWSVY